MRRFALVAACCAALATPAHADPLRLRADAYASTASPVGLLNLDAGGTINEWLRTEAVVWLGSGGDGKDGDVLVIAAHARTPGGRVIGTLGRFIVVTGALRPVHIDGLDARARLPFRMEAEAFAGAPVVPAAGVGAWDWVTGGRVSRRLGDWGSAGVGYLEQRRHGELDTQELGLDVGAAVSEHIDGGAKLALDLISTAVAEAQLSAVRRTKAWRVEVYATHRSPSHLLPATSLFSVLGDVPSERAGAHVTWRAAPRLDLDVDGGARRVDTHYGENLSAKATLRLDDQGRGALALELRREGAIDGGWTGGSARLRLPLVGNLTAATELELIRPDHDDHGAWWPWALGAVSYRYGLWDAAVAVEASASPEYRYRIDALARLGRRWEISP